MVARLFLLVLVGVLAGCGSKWTMIPGTTTRVSESRTTDNLELDMKIFTSPAACKGFGITDEELHLCLPHVDRASGEVRVAFTFELKGGIYPMPLSNEYIDNLKVSHLGTVVQNGQGGQAVDIVPHNPNPVRQLFVLVIDGSSSMSENNRMKKVKSALLQRDVMDAFYPDETKTGVVLLQFTGGTPQPVGGQLRVLWNKDDYVDAVRQLRVLSGYTHLYDAVTYSTGELLSSDAIDAALETEDMAVTVVALTDGFNNLQRSDTCRDNADRLSVLLRHLERVRKGEGVNLRRRPTIFTVGLGRPLRPTFKLPDGKGTDVNPRELCGKRWVDRGIDGDLETLGIDNGSLTWIADRGGGYSYVSRDREGLGRAFRAAAAKRYDWFELRYRVDPFYLRRQFTTKVSLVSYASAQAEVDIHPSAWLDAPPGEVGPEGWTSEVSYLRTLVVTVPTLGLLIALSFVGAAAFNTRRALFGRTRPPKRRAPPPAAPPPGSSEGQPPPPGPPGA